MSLLYSDSLIDVIDIKSLEEEEPETLGTIDVNGSSYVIESFITDRKSIRVHAIGSEKDALGMLNLHSDLEARVTLGDQVFSRSGKIQQVGWEKQQTGSRIIISVILSDK